MSLKGTVRDLGFIAWSDPYALLEDSKSKKFKEAVKEEDQILESQYRVIPTDLKTRWTYLYENLPKKNTTTYYKFQWHTYIINVDESNRLMPSIVITKNSKSVLNLPDLRGFTTNNNNLAFIRDMSDGKESLSLELYNTSLQKMLVIDKVADCMSLCANYLYYIEAQDIYWFNTLVKLDIVTKKHKKLYSESDKKYVLSIVDNQEDIFIIRTNAIYQDIGIIQNDKIIWLAKGFGKKLPISKNSIAYDSYFTIDSEKIDYPQRWTLIDAKRQANSYIFILSKDTSNTLWLFSNLNKWTLISKSNIVCEIKFSRILDKYIFGYPNKPDIVMSLNANRLDEETVIIGPTYEINHGKTPVPWFSVQLSKTKNPKGVIICGYGSYGMNMKKQQQRIWLPWLEQNFMVVSLCVRGGGENGNQWWDASRTAKRRHVGVSDFVKGVEYIQSKFGFNNTNTVIYGRSAGGFLVTAACYELLDKITVVYAAKPYTDVLRTTSNLKELQTEAETEEFGLTYNNPVDFVEIMKISPYENIIKTPINPVILLTGGTNDTEVGSYMPLKYAKRLRDFEWKNVFCRIARNEGHFTVNELGEAMDGALCEYFINQSLCSLNF
jgi:protease II